MPSSSILDGGIAERRPRLPSLTGMRFVAALMVFFFHAGTEQLFSASGAESRFNSLFGQGGWTGVGFFFVLSGFILTWSMRPGDTVRGFWRRRFFKIYPNHVVTFAAAAILLGIVSHQAFDSAKAAVNLLLLQAWSPSVQYNTSFNAVTWSLSCEAFFYLMFPVLIRLIVRIRPERLWLYAGITVGAIALVPIIALALPHQPVQPVVNASAWQAWFVYLFPPVRMLDFVFGILMARIVLTGRKVPLGLGSAMALVILAFVAAPSFPLTYDLTTVTVLPLGLLIAAGAQEDIQHRTSWLASRPMIWLGEISYAFYLVHLLVLDYGRRALGTQWSSPAAIGIMAVLFGGSLVAATLLYYSVERPMMRRFGTTRARRAMPAPAIHEPGAFEEGIAQPSEETA